MKKRIKQGFTLVELVIVIAIIAILAAVLIPTFSNLITKANESADAQMVANLNKQLAISEITDGKNETMQEAIEDAKKAGYNTGAFLSTSNDILWDQETDRFIAVKKGNKVFAQDENQKAYKVTGESANDYRYWKVYKDSIPEIGEQKYSIYWAGSELPTKDYFNFMVGFDAGKCSTEGSIIIVYTNFNIKVRLNRGNLGILSNKNIPSIDCYGVLDSLYFQMGINDTFGTVTLHKMFIGSLSSGITGNLVSNDVKYHQSEEEVNNIITTSKIDHKVVKAEYNQHYYEDDKCVICERTETGVEPTSHVHKLEVTYAMPTCTEKGTITIKCTNTESDCDYGDDNSHSKTITIPKLGHVNTKYGEEIKPTCTTPGRTTGTICVRCGEITEGLEILAPDLHDFVEHQCTRCHVYDNAILEKVVSVSSFADIESIDWKGQDKSKEAIIIKLENDITCTADEFIEIFGTQFVPWWIDITGEVVGTTSNTTTMIFAIDIDLNNYTLTINGKDEEKSYQTKGIQVNGHVCIRDGNLILNGTSVYNSLLIPQKTNAKVTFKNLKVEAEFNPVDLEMVPGASINVFNSELKLSKIYGSGIMVSGMPDVYVYYLNSENEEQKWNSGSCSNNVKMEEGKWYVYDNAGNNQLGELVMKVKDDKGVEHTISNDYADEFANEMYVSVVNGKVLAYIFNPIIIKDKETNAAISFGGITNENLSWYIGENNNSNINIDENSKTNINWLDDTQNQ